MRSPGTGNCENRDDFFPPSLFVHSPRRRLKLRLAIDSNFTLSFSPNTGSDNCVPTHTLGSTTYTSSQVSKGRSGINREGREEEVEGGSKKGEGGLVLSVIMSPLGKS